MTGFGHAESISRPAPTGDMSSPAAKALRSALAMGCDRGVLLSDAKFAGSDTLATARTLASGLRREGAFDLVLSGERATDGETGQVGPAVGRILGMSPLAFVSAVEPVPDDTPITELYGRMITQPAPLPVVAADGRFVGTVSKNRLLTFLDPNTDADGNPLPELAAAAG